MLTRKLQNRSTACNDNGIFARPAPSVSAPNIFTAAVQAVGPISLSYVADGVMIISGGDRAVRSAA